MENQQKIIRVAAIIIKDSKILLALSKYGDDSFYLCPGGVVEGFETLRNAVKREVKEETNYDAGVGELLYAREWINPAEKANVLDLFFNVEIIDGKETHLLDPCIDKGVIQKLEWVSVDQLHLIDFEPKMLIPKIQKDFKNGFKNRLIYIGASP